MQICAHQTRADAHRGCLSDEPRADRPTNFMGHRAPIYALCMVIGEIEFRRAPAQNGRPDSASARRRSGVMSVRLRRAGCWHGGCVLMEHRGNVAQVSIPRFRRACGGPSRCRAHQARAPML